MRPGPSPFSLLRAARQANSSSSRRNAGTFRFVGVTLPKPPSMRARLRPLLPFFFWWTAITSLATHQLLARQKIDHDMGVIKAQISVLEDLIRRTQGGENIAEEEIHRQLEMVGLRERLSLTNGEEGLRRVAKDVSWGEALFGRRKIREEEEGVSKVVKTEAEELQEWTDAMRDATTTPTPPVVAKPAAVDRAGTVRRAPSSSVYLS